MHNHDGVLGYSQQQLNGRYPSHCGPTTPIGSTAAVAEMLKLRFRQVSVWCSHLIGSLSVGLNYRLWPILRIRHFVRK